MGVKLPEAVESEKVVLGSLILYSDRRMFEQSELWGLHEGVFQHPYHKAIYKQMKTLYEKELPLDEVSIIESLESSDPQIYKAVGGAAYISDLLKFAVPENRFRQFVQSLVNIWTHRKVVSLLIKAAKTGVSEARLSSPSEVYLPYIQQITTLVHQSNNDDDDNEPVAKFLERLNRGTIVESISTGYYGLDTLRCKFDKGDLIVLAARPRMGKTAFAINLANNLLQSDKKVVFYSLEMATDQILARLVSLRSGVKHSRIMYAPLKPDEWQDVSDSIGDIIDRFFVSDKKVYVSEIIADIYQKKYKGKCDVAIVDYLQLVLPHRYLRHESRERQIAEVTRAFKRAARELEIPIVLIAQLNRDVDKRSNKTPMLSDLRESGAIEQDADKVMFLFRPILYVDEPENEPEDRQRLAKVIIAKNRNGEEGVVKFDFYPEVMKFEERI